MRETGWKRYMEGGRHYRIGVRFGIDYDFARRNNQSPYFSITGEIERLAGGWREDSGGMLHDEISKHFPELRPYLKWHLVGPKGPMHYIANAQYWWELYNGTSQFQLRPHDPDPKLAFMNTVVATEAELPPRNTPWPEVKAWLEERLETLLAEWESDMEILGVLE